MANGVAAVLVSPKTLEIWDVPISEPQRGGVRVKVLLAGVCGTDLHLLSGAYELDVPIVLGHEGVGILEALGEGVSTDYAGTPIQDGDLVCWAPYTLCHRCYACTILEETPCANGRFYKDARQPGWGTYAQYAWLPEGLAFYRLPDGANPETVTALGCGLPTALRAFERHGGLPRGADVVVLGAGPVGLSAVLLARDGGARTIVVVDGSPARRNAALQFGADLAIDLSVDVEARRQLILESVGARGPSLVVEAAGSLQAYRDALDIVAPHGSVMVVGIGANQQEIGSSPGKLTRSNLTVVGASYPKPKHYFEAMQLAVKLEPQRQLSKIITHRFPINDVEQAFAVSRSGEAIKVVITPNAPA